MTSWRKLNTNLVHFWAPKPEYRLFLVPVCIIDGNNRTRK